MKCHVSKQCHDHFGTMFLGGPATSQNSPGLLTFRVSEVMEVPARSFPLYSPRCERKQSLFWLSHD